MRCLSVAFADFHLNHPAELGHGRRDKAQTEAAHGNQQAVDDDGAAGRGAWRRMQGRSADGLKIAEDESRRGAWRTRFTVELGRDCVSEANLSGAKPAQIT